ARFVFCFLLLVLGLRFRVPPDIGALLVSVRDVSGSLSIRARLPVADLFARIGRRFVRVAVGVADKRLLIFVPLASNLDRLFARGRPFVFLSSCILLDCGIDCVLGLCFLVRDLFGVLLLPAGHVALRLEGSGLDFISLLFFGNNRHCFVALPRGLDLCQFFAAALGTRSQRTEHARAAFSIGLGLEFLLRHGGVNVVFTHRC